ncbi:hypothetical protein TSAR_000518 [Trichomalopsis sarcophagae]|uniref:Uncharacterized protein n=1 Tax=Trichomalopsis sarcophagae TaxID=543379 RepID=A0A232F3D0_9HYME|nr:hypothetical protein TSAR_000518 [Trichomalopsis sarcophagae]
MALFRSNLQISSKSSLTNPKALLSSRRQFASSSIKEKFFRSWFRKNEEKPSDCPKADEVFCESSCRRRLPECPEHVCTGAPSRCSEKGYGEPIKLKKSSLWLSPRISPVVIKEKPSNCKPPPCEKRESFREYIFGPEKPLPHANTCRMAYKYKQMCRYKKFMPLKNSSRKRSTTGGREIPDDKGRRVALHLFHEAEDLLDQRAAAESTAAIHSPERRHLQTHLRLPFGARLLLRMRSYGGRASLPHESVITTIISFTYTSPPQCLNSYIHIHRCPVHSKPFRLPYEELRPRDRRINKFFTCEEGIAGQDVIPPPRREACTCPRFKCDSAKETCALHEALRLRREEVQKVQSDDEEVRKMSRCERLKILTAARRRMATAACGAF